MKLLIIHYIITCGKVTFTITPCDKALLVITNFGITQYLHWDRTVPQNEGYEAQYAFLHKKSDFGYNF